jgi:hypothetical protein
MWKCDPLCGRCEKNLSFLAWCCDLQVGLSGALSKSPLASVVGSAARTAFRRLDAGQARALNIHEYLSHDLMKEVSGTGAAIFWVQPTPTQEFGFFCDYCVQAIGSYRPLQNTTFKCDVPSSLSRGITPPVPCGIALARRALALSASATTLFTVLRVKRLISYW